MHALVALFVALALFWLSTRQFPTLWRLLVWAGGVALLACAILWPAESLEPFGLRQAIGDAWTHRGNFADAAIVQAFLGNAGSVARFIPQLLDFFLIAGALLGVLALVAFTRGERLENGLRPTILALIGFIAGSTATLAVVAIGLGGQAKPRVFLGHVSQHGLNGEPSVHDGDTFWLGEISLRLWGVDAPEMSQTCRGVVECGEAARAQLESFLVGALVQCDQHQSINTGRWTESFGRPLVKCWRINGSERVDVGGWMIQNGLATQYRNDARYGYHDQSQEGASHGLMRTSCWLRPDQWRSNREARAAFENDTPLPAGAKAVGHCSRGPA